MSRYTALGPPTASVQPTLVGETEWPVVVTTQVYRVGHDEIFAVQSISCGDVDVGIESTSVWHGLEQTYRQPELVVNHRRLFTPQNAQQLAACMLVAARIMINMQGLVARKGTP